MTKTDLVELLKKEFTNAKGNIDIYGLDFGEFEGNLNLGGMKLKGDIHQSLHKNKGDIYQSYHANKGHVFQDEHQNEGEVIN